MKWLDFAANIYKRSHAAGTVPSYAQAICRFREFLNANGKQLNDVIIEIRSQPNGIVYRYLDNFSAWCDVKGFRPKTIYSYMNAARRLLAFLDIEIEDKKFKDKVRMSMIPRLREEYPTNEIIRRILNACSPKTRTWILVMIHAGLEPVDATKLKPKYLKFDEDPARILIDRQKTGERIETFIDKETADLIQRIIQQNNLSPDDHIFIKGEFTDSKLKQMRTAYNYAVARAGFGMASYNPQTRQRRVILDKIDGHKFGKFHLKLWKKRWFSIAKSVDYWAKIDFN